MTSPTGRLYALAATLATFFLLWALVAAHPWPLRAQTPTDPRLLAVKAREVELRKRAAHVKLVVNRRWATYERRLAIRQRQIAAAETRHLRELEAAYRNALQVANAANGRAATAEAYARSVVAWANAQLAARAAARPVATRTRPEATTAAPAGKSTLPSSPAAPTPTPATAPAPTPTPTPAPAPAPTPAPAPAPAPKPAPAPPVVVSPAPPVTTTKSSS